MDYIMIALFIAAFAAVGVGIVKLEESGRRPIKIIGKILSKVWVAVVAVPFVLTVVVGCLCIVLNLLGIL